MPGHPYVLPGSIGVTPCTGFVPWAIRHITRAPVAHAFITTGGSLNGQTVIIEAEPGGARYGTADEYGTVYWLTGLTDHATMDERLDAVHWAVQHLGTPYSWIDDAEIGLTRLLHWAPKFMRRRLRSDKTLMCSQLVVAAWRAAGLDLFPDLPDGAIAPGDLWHLAVEQKAITSKVTNLPGARITSSTPEGRAVA